MCRATQLWCIVAEIFVQWDAWNSNAKLTIESSRQMATEMLTCKDVDIQPSKRNTQHTPDCIPHKNTQRLDQHQSNSVDLNLELNCLLVHCRTGSAVDSLHAPTICQHPPEQRQKVGVPGWRIRRRVELPELSLVENFVLASKHASVFHSEN